MTLAVGHREADLIVLDALREARAPFSPERVVEEFTATLKAYRVTRVLGDRYAGEWPREQFSKRGIVYEPSEKAKSDLYRDGLPLFTARQVALLDNKRLVNQLCSLERRVNRGGRDTIDHPTNGADDLANAVAGVFVNLGRPATGICFSTLPGLGISANRQLPGIEQLDQRFLGDPSEPLRADEPSGHSPGRRPEDRVWLDPFEPRFQR